MFPAPTVIQQSETVTLRYLDRNPDDPDMHVCSLRSVQTNKHGQNMTSFGGGGE